MATRLFRLFVLLSLCPALVRAQAPPDTLVVSAGLDSVIALPNVTVEAQRVRLRSEAAAMRVTMLGAEDIAATSARTVADLLEARTGLFIKRYGEGGLATVSLRGTNSAQTLVLVDGQRVADPQSGQVDVSLLPTVLLESVDVLHGAHAARYGSDGIGGVVRLHTLQPTADGRVRTTGRLGAFGARSAGIVASGGHGPVTGLAAVEVSRSERDFSYVDESLFPPRTLRRRGADRALATVFGKVNVDGQDQHLSVSGWFNDVERGMPGASNAAPSGARQWDTHRRLHADYRTYLGASVLTLRGRAQHTHLRYANPTTDTRTETKTAAYGIQGSTETPLGTHWTLRSDLELGYDAADLREGVHRAKMGASVQGVGAYGRWSLYPALRLDRYEGGAGAEDLTALSPQLGVNVRPLAWPGLHLKGQIGRAFRAPTFGERFYEPGGNPALGPERGWSADAGAVVETGGTVAALQAEATVFTARIHDQIAWFPSFVGPGVQVWRPKNVARVVSNGLEASGRGQARLAKQLHVDGGLTFTYTASENRADPDASAYGHQLRYLPRRQFKLFAGAVWGPLSLDLTGRLVGERFVTSDETQSLAPYRVVDVRMAVTRALGPVSMTLDLTIENLFDTDYEIIRFYPMPPRHARLRLTLEFNR